MIWPAGAAVEYMKHWTRAKKKGFGGRSNMGKDMPVALDNKEQSR